MGLKLNGATDGSIELNPQDSLGSDRVITLNATGNSTLTLPDSNGTLDRLERAGNILQVVQNYITTTNSVSLTTDNTINIPDFSQSITPTSSSSKILVRVRWNGELDTANNQSGVFRLFRDTTLIGNAPASGSRKAGISVTFQGYWDSDPNSTPDSTWFEYLDTPNTTSTITYQLAVNFSLSATLYLNRTSTDDNLTSRERLTSSITLIEVAA